jgi:hypothetical protein
MGREEGQTDKFSCILNCVGYLTETQVQTSPTRLTYASIPSVSARSHSRSRRSYSQALVARFGITVPQESRSCTSIGPSGIFVALLPSKYNTRSGRVVTRVRNQQFSGSTQKIRANSLSVETHSRVTGTSGSFLPWYSSVPVGIVPGTMV